MKKFTIVVVGILFLASLGWGMAQRRIGHSLPTVSIPVMSPKTVPYETPSPSHLPGLESLTNEFGIRLKVIPAKDELRCMDRVPNGVPAGQSLKLFRPLFVFAFYPSETDPEFVQVGSTPRRASILGWLKVTDIALWPTRLGVSLITSAASPGVGNGSGPPLRSVPLLVYQDRSALEDMVQTGKTQAEPIAIARASARSAFMPWLISKSVDYDHGGRKTTLLQLHFLGEYKSGSDPTVVATAATTSYSAQERSHILSSVRMVDIVFVVDNTASTTPNVPQIIEAVKTIVHTLSQRSTDPQAPPTPDVAFGLVLYRDYVKGLMFDDGHGGTSVTQVFWDGNLQSDPSEFDAVVSPLRAATIGSDDPSEAGFDGVDAAQTKIVHRGGGLSEKIIILIGDNSFHEPGSPKNPRGISAQQLIDRATQSESPTKIYSLCVPGMGDAAERERHLLQFTELAERTGGKCHPLSHAGEVAKQILSVVQSTTAVVDKRLKWTEAVSHGSVKGFRNTLQDYDLHEFTEVMEFLQRAGVDPDRLNSNAPTFATGWCLAELNGTPVVETKVFLARAELDALISDLHELSVRLNPEQVTKFALVSRVSAAGGFFAADREESLDVFHQARGVPSRRDSILRLTQSEVQHMPEERRARLKQYLDRQVIPNLVNCRNDESLWQWFDDLEFGWVPEALLP